MSSQHNNKTLKMTNFVTVKIVDCLIKSRLPVAGVFGSFPKNIV